MKGVGKSCNFLPISRYSLKTVEDRWVLCYYAFDQHRILFFIHVTFTAIVPGAYPGEAKMCLRLIAETDARSFGDSHPSCYKYWTINIWSLTVEQVSSSYLLTDDSCRSKVFSGICDSVCVFVHMIKLKQLKLKSPNLAHNSSPSNYYN